MGRGSEIKVKAGERDLCFKYNTLAEMYYSEELRRKGLGPYEQMQPIEQEITIIWVGLKAFGFEKNGLPHDFTAYDCAGLLDEIDLTDIDRIKDAADEGMLFTGASMMRQLNKMEAIKKEIELKAGKNGKNTTKTGLK